MGERVSPLKGRWFQRDLPYSWDFFMENVLDPTHVSDIHHAGGMGGGVAGWSHTAASPIVRQARIAVLCLLESVLDPAPVSAVHHLQPCWLC
jgi:hypothetical protein